MKWLAAAVYALLCAGMAYVAFDKKIADRVRVFGAKCSAENSGTVFSKPRILVLAGIVFVTALTSSGRLLLDMELSVNLLKMMALLFVLSASACFDLREHRIPNILSGGLAAAGVVLLGAGFLTGQEGALSYCISSVLSAAACAVGLSVASLLTHGGIGFGDIKLFTALALTGGVYVTCGVLFFSVLVCAAAALLLMAVKKKELQSAVPFAPFMFAAYVAVIFLKIY